MQRDMYTSLQTELPVVIPVVTGRNDKWITGHSHAGQPHSGLPVLMRMVARKEVASVAPSAAGWDFLVHFNAYLRAQQKGDELATGKLLRKLIELHNPAGQLDQSTLSFVFGAVLSRPEVGATWATSVAARLLEGCTLTYWVRDGSHEMEPAMYCPDMGHAITVHMLFGNMFRVCPRCEKVFTAKYPGQDCCSIRCREAHRVARHRFRQKNKKEQD